MNDILGQFLRYLHIILICNLQYETKSAHLYPTNSQLAKPEVESGGQYFDRQTFIQIVKLLQALIYNTPYHLMQKGLATILMSALINNLQTLDKINNRDQLLRNEICAAINQALSKPDLIPELKASFFKKGPTLKTTEVLLNTIFRVQNFISNEKLQIFSTLGKNYPEVITYKWLDEQNQGKLPKVQQFLQQSLDKIDVKKCSQVLKIIEDWLKNY